MPGRHRTIEFPALNSFLLQIRRLEGADSRVVYGQGDFSHKFRMNFHPDITYIFFSFSSFMCYFPIMFESDSKSLPLDVLKQNIKKAIERLYREKKPKAPVNKHVKAIINRWEQDPSYLTKSGKPRVLRRTGALR